MSHSTPATYLAWAILSTMLEFFLVVHLYKFDQFKCLKWSNGPYSGAFKRIMTYTYLITVPLIAGYAIGFAVIKYQVGYSAVTGYGIIPTPWQLWPKSYQDAILPLNLILSVGWSLEMVTHLEELCFWLFLINAGRAQQDWFRSLYFRTWVVGSCAAVIYMPLVTIFTRHDPVKCEAFTFLAGSLGSLCITLWFLPILWAFPSFLENLKRESVENATIVRLTGFHELNGIRIVFRFLFTVPLLILGADGIRGHHHVNESFFATEFLAIIAGIGIVVSSGITLVIFFPRSIAKEIAVKEASRELKNSVHLHTFRSEAPEIQTYELRAKTPRTYTPDFDALSEQYTVDDSPPLVKKTTFQIEPPVTTFVPNRRLPSGTTIEGGIKAVETTTPMQQISEDDPDAIHPFVHNFTSPIDLMQGDGHSYGHSQSQTPSRRPTRRQIV